MKFDVPVRVEDYVTITSEEIANFLAEDPERFELPYTSQAVEEGLKNNDPCYREAVHVFLEEVADERLSQHVYFDVDTDCEILVS